MPLCTFIHSLALLSGIGAFTLRSGVRDVGVAGSNPVTPTIDFAMFFASYPALGARLKSGLV
jgi:hypothetical protein